MSTWVWVGGGALLLGIGYMVYSSKQRAAMAAASSTNTPFLDLIWSGVKVAKGNATLGGTAGAEQSTGGPTQSKSGSAGGFFAKLFGGTTSMQGS